MDEKDAPGPIPLDDGKVIDLSQPPTENVRCTFVRDEGEGSAILKIIKPKETRYEYDGKKVSYVKVSRSDLTTVFKRTGDLEYLCTPQAFTDMVDELQANGKELEVKEYHAHPRF